MNLESSYVLRFAFRPLLHYKLHQNRKGNAVGDQTWMCVL